MFATTGHAKRDKIEDGVYFVERSGSSPKAIKPLAEEEFTLKIQRFFKPLYKNSDSKYVTQKSKHIPLLLNKIPDAKLESRGIRTLLMTLDGNGTQQLSKLIAENPDGIAVLVIKEKIVSIIHLNTLTDTPKIKVPGCTDKAAEFIYFELKNNLKNKIR